MRARETENRGRRCGKIKSVFNADAKNKKNGRKKKRRGEENQ